MAVVETVGAVLAVVLVFGWYFLPLIVRSTAKDRPPVPPNTDGHVGSGRCNWRPPLIGAAHLLFAQPEGGQPPRSEVAKVVRTVVKPLVVERP